MNIQQRNSIRVAGMTKMVCGTVNSITVLNGHWQSQDRGYDIRGPGSNLQAFVRPGESTRTKKCTHRATDVRQVTAKWL